MKETFFGIKPTSLFEDGLGPGLEPVSASFSRKSKPFIWAEAPTFFQYYIQYRVKRS